MAAGLLILAGTAGRWLHFAKADHLYILGAMLIAIGTVVQDVVADEMSTEVVPRVDAKGNEKIRSSAVVFYVKVQPANNPQTKGPALRPPTPKPGK